MRTSANQLSSSVGQGVLPQVVRHDWCIGCGVCAGIHPQSLKMAWSEEGVYWPRVTDQPDPEELTNSIKVCPFSPNPVVNEDQIAEALYASQPDVQHSSETGFFLANYAGFVADDTARLASASGGLLTWTLAELLRTGAVDGVICVGPGSTPDRLFEYRIVETLADLETCRKSKYYPVELSTIIPRLLESEKRYAFAGIPCYCKAIRLAMRLHPALAARIPFVIGLVCGHLKTRQFAQYLSRCCGVQEPDILTVDFRCKLPDRRTSDYAFEVVAQGPDGPQRHRIRMNDVFGGSWGYCLFMQNPCNWCDDVFAETADLAVGDAWLERYVTDSLGCSLLVVRNRHLHDLLLGARNDGRLHLESLGIAEVIASQEGALRHRRAGLAYRLATHLAAGLPTLPKRVHPDIRALPLFNRVIQWMRIQCMRRSRAEFLKQQQLGPGTQRFRRRMWLWIRAYDWLYRGQSLWRKIRHRLRFR
jgi:coenzyme F420 hydrogenase subunit beta